MFSIDNQALVNFDTGLATHTLLVGLDHQSLDFDEQQGIDLAPSLDLYSPVYGAIIPTPPLFEDLSQKQSQTGLYIQDQIKFYDKYVLQLGGRYDWVSSDQEERIFDTRDDQNDRDFSGRAGLVYLADNGLA